MTASSTTPPTVPATAKTILPLSVHHPPSARAADARCPAHGGPGLTGAGTAAGSGAARGRDAPVGQRRQDGHRDEIAGDEARVGESPGGVSHGSVVPVLLSLRVRVQVQARSSGADHDAAQILHHEAGRRAEEAATAAAAAVTCRRWGRVVRRRAARILEDEAEREARADGRVGQDVGRVGGEVV